MNKLSGSMCERFSDLKTQIRQALNKMEKLPHNNNATPATKQDLLFKALSLYCQNQRDCGDQLIMKLETHGFSTTVFYELCNHNRIDCRFSTFLALGEIFNIPDEIWYIPLIRYLIDEPGD